MNLTSSPTSLLRLRLWLPLCGATLLCGGAILTPLAVAQPAVARGGDYRLGVGDALKITVSNHPDVDSEVVVRPDGKITLPRAGEIVASGKTAARLASEIERILARTLNNARVRVIVKEAAAQQMLISGAVKSPGPYPFKPGLRVLNLIGFAGGLEAKASRVKGRVIRRGQGEIPFDVSRAISNPTSAANVLLRADDLVILEAQDFSKQLTVTGNVKSPGNYDLDEGLTVAGLLAQAGGVEPNASLRSAYVVRDNKTIPLDLRGFESGNISANSPLSTFRFQLGDVLTVPGNLDRIGVTGEVKEPSFYSLPEDAAQATVLRVLAQAGGPQEGADLSRVTLTRVVDGERQVSSIDAAAIQRGEAPDNVVLLPDDVLFVPRRDKNVVISGAVAKPGSYAIDDKETLLSALAKAGDPTKDASLRKVFVFRDGKQIPLDLRPVLVEGALDPEVAGFRLMSGDVIRVSDTSDQVTISGAVARPGLYNLSDDLTVVSLLAQAGNGTDEAALGNAYVLRQNVKIPLDLNVFLSGTKEQPSLTGFRLKPGDTLMIPENEIFYAVLGEVNKPGKISYPENPSQATVLNALFQAGGPTGTTGAGSANLKDARIIRFVGGQVTPIPVNLQALLSDKKDARAQNMILQPSDLLYIPTKGKGFSLGEALGAASIFNILR